MTKYLDIEKEFGLQIIDDKNGTIYTNTSNFYNEGISDYEMSNLYNKYIQMFISIVNANSKKGNKDFEIDKYVKTFKKCNIKKEKKSPIVLSKTLLDIFPIPEEGIDSNYSLLNITSDGISKQDMLDNKVCLNDVYIFNRFLLMISTSEKDVYAIFKRENVVEHQTDPYRSIEALVGMKLSYDNLMRINRCNIRDMKSNIYKYLEMIPHLSSIDEYTVRKNNFGSNTRKVSNNDYISSIKSLEEYFRNHLGSYYLDDVSLGQNILRNDKNIFENWLKRHMIIEFYESEIKSNFHYIKYIGYDFLECLIEISKDILIKSQIDIVNNINKNSNTFFKVHFTWKSYFENIVYQCSTPSTFLKKLSNFVDNNKNMELFKKYDTKNRYWDNWYKINNILIILLISSCY